MAEKRERTLGESLNTWLQIVGILVAAVWAAWTFVYKEIQVPQSAPINISMNLQLKKAGVGTGKAPMVALEMRISATNPSTRRVYLLPSLWTINGCKRTPSQFSDDESFGRFAVRVLNAHAGQSTERYSSLDCSALVAAGDLFTDVWLNPGESVARTEILHIPSGRYDLVSADASMPTADVEVIGKWSYRYSWEDGGIVGELCRVNTNHECAPVAAKGERGYIDAGIGYQVAESQSEISLWE